MERFAKSVAIKFYPEHAKEYILKPFINENDFGQGGFGGNSTALLLDKKGGLLAVLKGGGLNPAYLAYYHLLVPACDMLRLLPLKRSTLALPIATEHLTANGDHFQLIATPGAPGQALTALIANKMAVKEAVGATARALAELHSLSSHNDRPIASHFISMEDAVVAYFLGMMELAPSQFPFSIELFKRSFAELFSQAHKQPFPSGYIHGDSNITNIFFDLPSRVTFIDSLTMFHAIDREGYPAGNIIQDYAACRFSLELYGHYYGMVDDELKGLDKLFCREYSFEREGRGFLPEQLSFAAVLHWISYAKIIDCLKYNKPQMAQRLSPLLCWVLKRLGSILLGS